MKSCPSCKSTYTDEKLQFCLTDGMPLIDAGGSSFDSQETLWGNKGRSEPPPTEPYRPYIHAFDSASHKSTSAQRKLYALLIASLVIILASIGGVVYLLSNDNSIKSGSLLPDHYGIFLRSGNGLSELRRRDFSNALQGRDTLMDGPLTQATSQPTFILFAEQQDIPLSELKLVQVDKMDAKGNARYWDYQVAPVEGHSTMKQIRVSGGLENGKYAFAIINGYIDEGNHRFWSFQVTEGGPVSSDAVQATTLPLKPKRTSSPPPQITTNQTRATTNTPPAGTTLAYCNKNNVYVRSGPSLDAEVISIINKNQTLWVFGTTSNYTTYKGFTTNWTEVQLVDTTTHGYVWSYFIEYH